MPSSVKVGDAADQSDETRVFLGLEAVRDRQRFVDARFLFAHPNPPHDEFEVAGIAAQAR